MSGVDASERRARIVLSRVCEPGDPDACDLVREFSAITVIERLRSRSTDGGSKLAGWRDRLPDADADELVAAAEAVGARFICPGDPEWPFCLADLDAMGSDPSGRRASAPFGLWVRGTADLASVCARSVALVGSRASSAYGERVAGQLAFDCGLSGYAAVSGGAYGIDAAAHRGALARGNPTVAVLANGIDELYPAGHRGLLASIIASGLVVTEIAPGARPSRSRFLVRNRLIAALSQGTVVVEAALRSGSLNTARWARDLGRPVMGVPGPVTSVTSAGVHQLLREPDVIVVTSAREVIEHVAPIGAAL